MREFIGLYRGKRLDNGKWIEGAYCKLDTVKVCFTTDDPKTKHLIVADGFCDWGFEPALVGHKVDPDTVGECTGLLDKNGKLIFEGDIVKTHYANVKKTDFVEEVVFRNGKFCALFQKDGCKMWCPLADGVPHHPGDKTAYMEWCEVIGNVIDSPELLKGGEGDE